MYVAVSTAMFSVSVCPYDPPGSVSMTRAGIIKSHVIFIFINGTIAGVVVLEFKLHAIFHFQVLEHPNVCVCVCEFDDHVHV